MQKDRPDTPTIPLALHRDRVKMLYEHVEEGTLSNYFWSIAILSILLLSGVNVFDVAVLGSLLFAVQLIKSHYMKIFFKLEHVQKPFLWEKYMMLASFAQAFIISAGVMSLVELHQNLATYVLIILIVIPAFVSALVLIASVHTHYAWLSGLLLPIAFKSALSDDPIYWVFSGLIILGGIPSSALVGKKISESFVDTLKLRFENTELLETVRAEKERAEKANADKSRFLASASHDLRQPIHALELFSDALENQLDKPKQMELMKRIKESTSAMNGLLYSLLDISRLDAGIVHVDKQAVVISKLLQNIADTFQEQAQKQGIALSVVSEPCGGFTDIVLLESILTNLVGNAMKYTSQGEVSLLCTCDGKQSTILVKDTGKGISADQLDMIFDEFYQVDNSERDRNKGLGLGLAIVKRTCALLGHHLHVESELGVGSTFSLILEAALIKDVPEIKPVSLNKQLQATILVIDDEEAILEGMIAMLEPWGCKVFTAVDEHEARLVMQDKAGHIDIIIADYRLRGEQLGTDVVKHLPQDKPIPSIIITGDTGPEQLLDVKESGFYLLHKPVPAMRMRALIQNILKQSKT